MYQDLLSASLAGAMRRRLRNTNSPSLGTVAKLALHPVDTVRTRLQIAEVRFSVCSYCVPQLTDHSV